MRTRDKNDIHTLSIMIKLIVAGNKCQSVAAVQRNQVVLYTSLFTNNMTGKIEEKQQATAITTTRVQISTLPCNFRTRSITCNILRLEFLRTFSLYDTR